MIEMIKAGGEILMEKPHYLYNTVNETEKILKE
jgi:hypothetical protein